MTTPSLPVMTHTIGDLSFQWDGYAPRVEVQWGADVVDGFEVPEFLARVGTPWNLLLAFGQACEQFVKDTVPGQPGNVVPFRRR